MTTDFNQTDGEIGLGPYYTQSSTGGITGGSVVGYSGSDYNATGVYDQRSFNFSVPASTIYQSLDIFYNGNTQPLAPGANAVRSFRLGLLISVNSAFETYGDAAVYIEGEYSLTDHKMILVGSTDTGNILTSLELSEIQITPDHWYRVQANFINKGNNQVEITGSFLDLGPNGNSAPIPLATWDWTYQNQPIAEPIAKSSSLYSGFSVLADGGASAADNYGVDVVPLYPVAAPTIAGTGFRSDDDIGNAGHAVRACHDRRCQCRGDRHADDHPRRGGRNAERNGAERRKRRRLYAVGYCGGGDERVGWSNVHAAARPGEQFDSDDVHVERFEQRIRNTND